MRLHHYIQSIAELDGNCGAGPPQASNRFYTAIQQLHFVSMTPPQPAPIPTSVDPVAGPAPSRLGPRVRSVACQTCICGLLEVDLLRRMIAVESSRPAVTAQDWQNVQAPVGGPASGSVGESPGRCVPGAAAVLGGQFAFHPYQPAPQRRLLTDGLRQTGWWLSFVAQYCPACYADLMSPTCKALHAFSGPSTCPGCAGELADFSADELKVSLVVAVVSWSTRF